MSPIINPTVEGKPEKCEVITFKLSPFTFDFSSRQNILFGQRNFHDSMNALALVLTNGNQKLEVEELTSLPFLASFQDIVFLFIQEFLELYRDKISWVRSWIVCH